MLSVTPVSFGIQNGVTRRNLLAAAAAAALTLSNPKQAKAVYDETPELIKQVDERAAKWDVELSILQKLLPDKKTWDVNDFKKLWNQLTHMQIIAGKMRWQLEENEGYLNKKEIKEVEPNQLTAIRDKNLKTDKGVLKLTALDDMENNWPEKKKK